MLRCFLLSSETGGRGEGGGARGGPSPLQDPPTTLLHPQEAGHLPETRRNPGHLAADGGETVCLSVSPSAFHTDCLSLSLPVSLPVQSLRRILFGGTFHVFNYEWRKSFFQFREPNSELSFALETDRVRTAAAVTNT